ncbi:MAG: hypothetical protein PHP82_03790 [Candidatus ainarchaeum sp.]|nr:hypothetical protein [Candidatus ainarchaeum sp.]
MKKFMETTDKKILDNYITKIFEMYRFKTFVAPALMQVVSLEENRKDSFICCKKAVF